MKQILEKTEIIYAEDLKNEFGKVKDQIHTVKEQMSNLQQKTEDLICHLEDLRIQEQNFIKILNEKYGPGKLNPLTLYYEKY